MPDASWQFPVSGVLYEVTGVPPVLFFGWTSSGDEAVVTWTGADSYELDVALAGGSVLHKAGRFPDPTAAKAAVAALAAAGGA